LKHLSAAVIGVSKSTKGSTVVAFGPSYHLFGSAGEYNETEVAANLSIKADCRRCTDGVAIILDPITNTYIEENPCKWCGGVGYFESGKIDGHDLDQLITITTEARDNATNAHLAVAEAQAAVDLNTAAVALLQETISANSGAIAANNVILDGIVVDLATIVNKLNNLKDKCDNIKDKCDQIWDKVK
jgi:hypothetical protein